MYVTRYLRIVLLPFLFGLVAVAGMAQDQPEQPEQEDPADAEAADAGEAAELEEGGDYAGTWSLVIGPSRLLWELEEESYEFYAYQAGSVRLGSRGEIRTDEAEITFVPLEITEDGEEWRDVELSEEDAEAVFTYAVGEDFLRLSIPGRPQFFTDYETGEGEPVEGEDDEDTADEAEEGEGLLIE